MTISATRVGAVATGKAPVLNSPTMAQIAARHNMFWGSSQDHGKYGSTDYLKYTFNELATYGVATPESSMNPGVIEPSNNSFNFTGMDTELAQCQSVGCKVRGHFLIDGAGVAASPDPSWQLAAVTNATTAQAIMAQHINAVMGRYKGQLHSITVVNESVKPTDFFNSDSNGYQMNIWYQYLGTSFSTGYIATALKLARAADPSTPLMLNFDACEGSDSDSTQNRAQILALLTGLKGAGIPLDLVGIEAHLPTGWTFTSALSTWFTAIQALGLRIVITELDFDDSGQSANQATRDTQDAAVFTAFVGACIAHPAVIGIQQWQLGDRDSWYQRGFGAQRADGLALRPDTLDGAYRVKPSYTAIASAFAADVAHRRQARPPGQRTVSLHRSYSF